MDRVRMAVRTMIRNTNGRFIIRIVLRMSEEPVLLYAAIESRAADAQGTRHGTHIAMTLLVGFFYGEALHLLESGSRGGRCAHGGHCGGLTRLLLEIGGSEAWVPGDEEGALHKVLELAHIARERLTREVVEGVGGQIHLRDVVGHALLVGEMACQQRNIVATLAHGR